MPATFFQNKTLCVCVGGVCECAHLRAFACACTIITAHYYKICCNIDSSNLITDLTFQMCVSTRTCSTPRDRGGEMDVSTSASVRTA